MPDRNPKLLWRKYSFILKVFEIFKCLLISYNSSIFKHFNIFIKINNLNFNKVLVNTYHVYFCDQWEQEDGAWNCVWQVGGMTQQVKARLPNQTSNLCVETSRSGPARTVRGWHALFVLTFLRYKLFSELCCWGSMLCDENHDKWKYNYKQMIWTS